MSPINGLTTANFAICSLFVLARSLAMELRRLVDYPFVLVRLRCDVCKRSGAYRLARLAVKFGSEILLDDLIVRLSADCAWRDDRRGNGCGARFVDLPPRRPPDIPASKRLRVIGGGKQQ